MTTKYLGAGSVGTVVGAAVVGGTVADSVAGTVECSVGASVIAGSVVGCAVTASVAGGIATQPVSKYAASKHTSILIFILSSPFFIISHPAARCNLPGKQEKQELSRPFIPCSPFKTQISFRSDSALFTNFRGH
jgi:hypothetical protein